ncbi:hypothetical protein M3P05_10030 [Sansalvadorimonas sp. 2012CJ34-2]|uniref:RES domain-containing protein n=1 Tax=Parendozoicomonas callyspongiae TaxID=2942213 RepID=A0ABT0PFV3_9GAMM|nr:hypothetical protein [Sansalvadorimonas sp. 2012CJ34-2]MCL6270259.1 hypothetical protein [Sansalvadorimonas sp. 2012CJ34-2]
MPNLAKVIRHASPRGLMQFCQMVGVSLPAVGSDTFALEQTLDVGEVFNRIRKEDHRLYLKAEEKATRIVNMTRPDGQQLLAQQMGKIIARNPFDTVIELMDSKSDKLTHAESSRFASHYRYGRMWDSYQLNPAVDPVEDIALQTFSESLSKSCQGQRFRTESFCYSRPDIKQHLGQVCHVAVTRQGVPQAISELDEESNIQTLVVSPAREYALTHEWGSGVVEVVANTRDMRDLLALTYARDVLKLDNPPERITPRQFGLEHFRERPIFQYTLRDGIALIQVMSLHLRSRLNGQPLIVDVPLELRFVRDIYDLLNENNLYKTTLEDRSGWMITGAVVGVQKRQIGVSARRHELFVRFTHPNSHNLRELTPEDRLLIQRIFLESGLLDESHQ